MKSPAGWPRIVFCDLIVSNAVGVVVKRSPVESVLLAAENTVEEAGRRFAYVRIIGERFQLLGRDSLHIRNNLGSDDVPWIVKGMVV